MQGIVCDAVEAVRDEAPSGADAVVVNAVAPNVHVLDFYHVG